MNSYKQLIDMYDFFLGELILNQEEYIIFYDINSEEREIIIRFVDYCKKKTNEALNEPRAPDGLSFLERSNNSVD